MRKAAENFVSVLCTLVVGAGVALTTTMPVRAQAQIVNFVSAGGSDINDPDLDGSGPGFDKNYSLVAFKFADGTARGLLIDRNAGGGGLGLRADIDCVHVVGNTAWISGIVTQGQFIDLDGNVISEVGWYVRTRVQDNGHNKGQGEPDRISFTQVRRSAPFVCSNMFQLAFWDMPGGQVTVR